MFLAAKAMSVILGRHASLAMCLLRMAKRQKKKRHATAYFPFNANVPDEKLA